MRRLLITLACIAIALPCFAQNADEPASRDDVILYLRTMHSHDMLKRMIEVQSESMQQLMRETILKDKGKLPADFDSHMKRAMEDLVKNMPVDDIVQAMIPAYQKYFTKGDIAAMNAFYSSSVGQKVLDMLPSVVRDGNQAAMPIMTKYLSDWQERMKHEFEDMKDAPAEKPSEAPAQQGAPSTGY